MLQALAETEAAVGQHHTGVVLSAAARALLEAIHAAIPEKILRTYERAQQRMREALGEDAFVAAWAEGQALSLDEAVALALGAGPAS